MEHDMTEQKREPKDYEIWYVMLSDGSIKPAVAWIPPNPENTVWYIDGDSCCADPIAPVASHELVAELIAAVNAGRIALSNRDRNDLDEAAYKMLRFILAKADLAGLGE